MRRFIACALACAFVFTSTDGYAWHAYSPPIIKPPIIVPPPVAPPVLPPASPSVTPASTPKSSGPVGGGGGAMCTGGCVGVAGFIGIIAVMIIKHEIDGPACASNTKRNRALGWDSPTLWRPLCNWKGHRHHMKHVKPAKLWPMGK